MKSTASNPLVTVISPFYNRANGVERTLESLAGQTFARFTSDLWDDGSLDGTWGKLVATRDRLGDPRITVRKLSSNMGLTPGLNQAIDSIDTKYIAVVGSGDWCHRDRISYQVEALEGDPDAVMCASASVTMDLVSGKEFLDSSFERRIFTVDDLLETVPFTHGTVMYRTSALKAVGGFEETFKWCADWDLFLRILETGHGVYLPHQLYTRIAQRDGVSFDPGKSFDQIRYQALVAMAHGRTFESRLALLRLAREEGLDASLVGARQRIEKGLSNRIVKLELMGRREEARELFGIVESSVYSVPYWSRASIWAARTAALSPVEPDSLIRAARRVAKSPSLIRRALSTV